MLPRKQRSTTAYLVFYSGKDAGEISTLLDRLLNKKHLKNVGPIRHCEPPHAPFTRCRYLRRLRIDVHNDDDDANDDDDDDDDNNDNA